MFVCAPRGCLILYDVYHFGTLPPPQLRGFYNKQIRYICLRTKKFVRVCRTLLFRLCFQLDNWLSVNCKYAHFLYLNEPIAQFLDCDWNIFKFSKTKLESKLEINR